MDATSMPKPTIRLTRGSVSVWINSMTPIAGLKWSYRLDPNESGGGCWSASWRLPALDGAFANPALRRGSRVEIFVGAQRAWQGIMSEPDRDDWSCSATGLSRMAEDYPAMRLVSSALTRTTQLRDAVNWAISEKRLPWSPNKTLPNAPFLVTDQTTAINTLGALLDAVATRDAQQWLVDEHGVARLFSSPTPGATPFAHISSTTPVPGISDENYFTDLYATFRSYPNGSTASSPVGTYAANVSASGAANRWEPRAKVIDLTPLGPLTNYGSTSLTQAIALATRDLNSRLSLVGGRMSYTAPIAPGAGELRTMSGAPMPPWLLRAGHLVRVHGLLGSDGNLDASKATDIVLQGVEIDADTGSVVLEPTGMVARDLSGILADATSSDTSTALSVGLSA